MATPGNNKVQIDTVIDASLAAAGAAQTAAALKQIEVSETEAQAAAEKFGVSVATATAALAAIKKEDAAAEFARLKDQMRSTGEETDATSAATERLGVAAEETGEKGNRMIEHMSSIRGSRMAAMEFFETLQGGGTTIEGITNLLRLFILTSDGLNPLMLALAGVALALTGLIAKHQEHGDAAKKGMDDATAATDHFKEAVSAATEVTNELAHQRQAALEDELHTMSDLMSAYDKRATYDKQRLTDLQAQLEATKSLTLANLESQKQDELNHSTSADQSAAIERRYANRAAQVNASTEAQKYQIRQEGIDEQLGNTNSALFAANDQRTSVTTQLQDLRQKAADAAAAAAAVGVKPDAAGSFAEVLKRLEDQNNAAALAYNQGMKDHVAPAKQNQLGQDYADLVTKTRAAYDAEKARGDLDVQGKPLLEKIDQLSATITKLNADYVGLLSQRGTVTTEQKAAEEDERTDAQKRQAEADRARREEGLAEREAQRKADREDMEAQMGREGISPMDKARLQTQIDQSQIAGYRDTLETKSDTLSKAEVIELVGQIKALVDKMGVQQGNALTSEGKKGSQQEDTAVLGEATAAIKGVGGSKSDVAQLKQAVDDMKRNPDGGLREVLGILVSVLGEHANANVGAISGLRQLITQLQQQIQALHDRTSYQNTN